jgi:uncharacterized protein
LVVGHILEPVRLSAHDLAAIKTVFLEFFQPGDELWLFGSRADLTKRGGDIDLYIETSIEDFSVAYQKESKMVIRICDKIGEQKIDVVVNRIKANKDLWIYQVARKTGVRLI